MTAVRAWHVTAFDVALWGVVGLSVVMNLVMLLLIRRDNRLRRALGGAYYARKPTDTSVDLVRPSEVAVDVTPTPVVPVNMFSEFDRQVREEAPTPVEVPIPAAIALTTPADPKEPPK